ncbi:uncharacterized protein LOC125885000 [Epinephelus fuscoguttatus]|uniref:uncharacterized protein LOC125885000 n=1 Tax=Epinephelus fuscoguttatus TaxID=293821 RepID=UPI0020D09FD5|nr:uncharacterized protein LOC125885000 [Epinephelus fuscoguttatus]
MSLLDSIGFSQGVHEPTHCFNHTLDLVLTYGIEIDNLKVFPQNPSLSDHYLITFDFFLLDYTPLSNSYYTRCLSDSAVAKFKEKITPSLNSIPSPSVTEVSCTDFDHFVDSAVGSLRTTLDSVAPLKKKLKKQRKFAPWYNSQTRKLKQISQKFERDWRLTKLEESRLIWTDSLKTYKRGLHNARANYYSELIEDNKNNPRFLFSTVARLTESQSSIEPCIPLALSSNDFMSFFNDKILTIRGKIHDLLSSDSTYLTSNTAVKPNIYLDCFSPISLQELTVVISSSKSSTCLLDPIPTRLLKEVFPLVNTHILDMINISVLTGYVPQSFKVAVIKPLLKKPTLDPEVLANYRPISNLPFMSKILEKVVADQLCDFFP